MESVSFEKTTFLLGVDDEEVIEYDVYPNNARKTSITWRSSNENAVNVINNKIIGLCEGKSIVSVMVGGNVLNSVIVEVHNHEWDEIVETIHHDEEGYFEAWDEVVIDEKAYDEVVVDREAWSEWGVVKKAYDEKVADSEAYDEIVIDQEYNPGTLYDKYVCTKCKRASDKNHEMKKCPDPMCGGTIIHKSWVSGYQEEISHIVHHDEVFHIVHHDDEYGTINHEAVTHTVHHEAVTHMVHHDEIRNKDDFVKGNKEHWIITKEAYDEDAVIGFKCNICLKIKEK